MYGHTRDNLGEERLVRRAGGFHLGFMLKAMLDELAGDRIGVDPCQFHLVDRLHRGQSRGTTRVVRARKTRKGRDAHRCTPSRFRVLISARQARAASPPLSPSSTAARMSACLSFSTVKIPFPIHKP